jgi:ribose transport system permease protein
MLPSQTEKSTLLRKLEFLKVLGSASGPAVALVIACLAFTIGSSDFLSVSNGVNILMQGTVLLLVSFGMGLTILTGGIDLSVGAVLGLSGVTMGILMREGVPLGLAFAAGMAVSSAVGLLNGILVVKANLPPFVATFGTMGMAQGLALVLSKEGSVWGIDPRFRWFVEGHIAGLPVPFILAVVLGIFFWGLLRHTAYGMRLYAIGGNQEAAQASGVPVPLYKCTVYIISGAITGLASALLVARMNSALPTAGMGYEWDSMAAAVVGGVAFEGGVGGIPGIIVGAALIAVVRNGLNLLGLGMYPQVVVIGLIIIGAFIIERFYRRKG